MGLSGICGSRYLRILQLITFSHISSFSYFFYVGLFIIPRKASSSRASRSRGNSFNGVFVFLALRVGFLPWHRFVSAAEAPRGPGAGGQCGHSPSLGSPCCWPRLPCPFAGGTRPQCLLWTLGTVDGGVCPLAPSLAGSEENCQRGAFLFWVRKESPPSTAFSE